MYKNLKIFAFLGLLWLATACSPTPEALPTVIPSATAIPITNTPVPPTVTRTPTITPTPSLPVPKTSSDNPAEESSLRVVNASPNVGAVDFYIDGLKFASFIDFEQYTNQSGIVAGDYTLRIVPKDAKTLTEPLLTQPISITGSTSVIVILTGTADALSAVIVNEDLRPLVGGQTRMLVVNTLTNQNTISTLNGTNPLVADVGSGLASEGVVIPTADVALNLRSNGAIVYAKNVDLRERQNYTLVVTDDKNDPNAVNVLTITTPIAGLGTVAIVNTSNDLSLDFYADDLMIAPQMGNGYISEPFKLTAQNYELKAYESGADPNAVEPLYSNRLTILPDEVVTLVLVGEANNLQIVAYRPNTQPTPPDQARIVFINTLPTVPKAQAQSNIDFNAVANYGQLTQGGNINAGTLSLTWYPYENNQSTGDLLETQTNIVLNAGSEYLYILTGRSDLPPFTLEQQVGVLPPAQSQISAQPTAQTAPYFYAINAVEGLTINVQMDDINLVTNLASRTGSSSAFIQEGEHTFTATRVDTGELIARLTAPIEFKTSYAAVVYGRAETGYQIYLVSEEISENLDNAPTLRLINISEDSSLMGMGLFTSTGTTPPFPDFNAPIDPDTGFIPTRTSLPIGLRRIVDNISSLSASPTTFLFRADGLQDIYIVDNNVSQTANILPNNLFEASKQYDIIVLQDPISGIVTAYVAASSKP